jgi:hypothetical protein
MPISTIFEHLLRIVSQLVSTPLKLSYVSVLIPGIIVMIAAVSSAKQLGGDLGNGLKKVAAGTIIYVIIYITVIIKEVLPYETMTEQQLRMFFVVSNLVGSVFLISGFHKMYKVSHKLKLF